jgi:Uncharacterized conserved protein related to pyruvate formate-lyase activating enzyme
MILCIKKGKEMLINLCNEQDATIKNPSLLRYAQIYRDIYKRFLAQITASGITLGANQEKEISHKIERLRDLGVVFRNDDKSLFLNWLSPACENCKTGVGSTTLFFSLQCPRQCYFCFNPNQEGYEYYRQNLRNCVRELQEIHQQGIRISHLALSGGEPLLHPAEVVNFFQTALDLFPKVYTRLYTAGDLLNPDLLGALQENGLNEIRFSLKLEDTEEVRSRVLNNIALAKSYIPVVMVEMPIIPGTLEEMKKLLSFLNDLDINGINLLEFCYPFYNTEEFRMRGFKIKNPPFNVLYDYWYAGGLPIDRSEIECLDLLEYAIEQQLKLGVHYCSLENKLTGQIYQQNLGQRVERYYYLSGKDHYYKSAKVFGNDILTVKQILDKNHIKTYNLSKRYDFLEFNVKDIDFLKDIDIEVVISSNVMEERNDGKYLRELKLDLINPSDFQWQNEL